MDEDRKFKRLRKLPKCRENAERKGAGLHSQNWIHRASSTAQRRCCDNAAAAAAANTKLAALQTELDEAKAAAAAKEMALDERNEQLTQSVLRGDELQKKLQEAEAAAEQHIESRVVLVTQHAAALSEMNLKVADAERKVQN